MRGINHQQCGSKLDGDITEEGKRVADSGAYNGIEGIMAVGGDTDRDSA